MEWEDAVEVHGSVREMLGKRNPNIVMISVDNIDGQYGVLIGAVNPEEVDVPKELDGVPIRVIQHHTNLD